MNRLPDNSGTYCISAVPAGLTKCDLSALNKVDSRSASASRQKNKGHKQFVLSCHQRKQNCSSQERSQFHLRGAGKCSIIYDDGACCRLGHGHSRGSCDGRGCCSGQINQGDHQAVIKKRWYTGIHRAGDHHELRETEVCQVELHGVLRVLAALRIRQGLQDNRKRTGAMKVTTIIRCEGDVEVHHGLIHTAILHVRAEGQHAFVLSKHVIRVDV
mmetsp:Transcript_74961/g.178925  ORF Transcript_74961/g.178925 Transcript_74961/m.178925 type:complete len:215 (-) Transcript_74961:489-1133(-)